MGKGERIVLVHGFTQNTRCWNPIPDLLSRSHEVVLVDAPGHGRSRHDRVGLWQAGRLLGEAGGEAHYVGYSMGGRMLLHLALQMPALVRSMTLIGASPGLPTPAERSERRRSDNALADRMEDEGLDAFLTYWLGLPLFSGMTAAMASRSDRLTNRVDGLADSLRRCGLGHQDPAWGRLSGLSVPTLILAGENDKKFSDVGKRMAHRIGPNARFESIAGASHSCHLERPGPVTDLITEFVT